MKSFALALVILLCLVLASAYGLYRAGTDRHRLTLYVARAVACLLIGTLLECTVFNMDAFATRHLTPIDLDLSTAKPLEPEPEEEIPLDHSAVRDTYVELTEENTLTIENINVESQTIELTFEGDGSAARARVYLADDANAESFSVADTKVMVPTPDGEPLVYRLNSRGKLRSVCLAWNSHDVRPVGARLNVPIPFFVSWLRLLVIVLPLLIANIALTHDVSTIKFDADSTNQRIALATCIALTIGLAWSVRQLTHPRETTNTDAFYAEPVAYPFERDVLDLRHQVHAIMFDTLFHKGVVQYSPSEELLALPNPYDRSARNEQEVPYLYDYALYNGNYYVYFGMTPIFVVYAPYYLLLGHLPSYVNAAFILACIAIVGCYLCSWEYLRRFARTTTLPGALLCCAAVALGSGILTSQVCVDRYYLTSLSAIAFFFWTLWSASIAERSTSRWRKPLFALCGIMTVLLIWSRPTAAMSAFGWTVPLFAFVLLDREQTGKSRALDAMAYAIPVAIGAAAIMHWNAIRFGSPMDFGQNYQLTVSDVSWNSVTPNSVILGLWHYLFDSCKLSASFPWVTPLQGSYNTTGNYMYQGISYGAFMVPITWGLILGGKRLASSRERIIACIALITSILICVIDFYGGGAHYRYLFDALPTISLLGALCFASHLTVDGGPDVADSLARTAHDSRAASVSPAKVQVSPVCARLLLVAFTLTAIMTLCLVFGNERNYIAQSMPKAYEFASHSLSIR